MTEPRVFFTMAVHLTSDDIAKKLMKCIDSILLQRGGRRLDLVFAFSSPDSSLLAAAIAAVRCKFTTTLPPEAYTLMIVAKHGEFSQFVKYRWITEFIASLDLKTPVFMSTSDGDDIWADMRTECIVSFVQHVYATTPTLTWCNFPVFVEGQGIPDNVEEIEANIKAGRVKAHTFVMEEGTRAKEHWCAVVTLQTMQRFFREHSEAIIEHRLADWSYLAFLSGPQQTVAVQTAGDATMPDMWMYYYDNTNDHTHNARQTKTTKKDHDVLRAIAPLSLSIDLISLVRHNLEVTISSRLLNGETSHMQTDADLVRHATDFVKSLVRCDVSMSLGLALARHLDAGAMANALGSKVNASKFNGAIVRAIRKQLK